ncbi:sialidase-3-like [Discoglossus pictus]
MEEATLKNHGTMNPCPVYEENDKVIFLFFNCIPVGVYEQHIITCGNQCKLCYITSTDVGKTWSSITDLTGLTNSIKNMATFSLGPGHGIQTQCGKLIIPAYTYVGKCWFLCWWRARPQSFYFYSEDRGHTWCLSQRITQYPSGELAEITCEDDKKMLYCNSRSMKGNRVEALTLDINGEFTTVEQSTILTETKGGCQGSIVSFVGETQSGHWLLFSHPSTDDRKDLGVYLNKSPEQFNSWSKPWVIYKGPSAYSDLVNCGNDNTFAVLFESGYENPDEEINFCLFSLKDVVENIK